MPKHPPQSISYLSRPWLTRLGEEHIPEGLVWLKHILLYESEIKPLNHWRTEVSLKCKYIVFTYQAFTTPRALYIHGTCFHCRNFRVILQSWGCLCVRVRFPEGTLQLRVGVGTQNSPEKTLGGDWIILKINRKQQNRWHLKKSADVHGFHHHALKRHGKNPATTSATSMLIICCCFFFFVNPFTHTHIYTLMSDAALQKCQPTHQDVI